MDDEASCTGDRHDTDPGGTTAIDSSLAKPYYFERRPSTRPSRIGSALIL